MTWLDDVRRIVELQQATFTIADLKPYYPGLKTLHPANHHVEEKVRQMLQNLVAAEELERLDRGTYRRTGAPALRIWPFAPGDVTSRKEISSVLGMDGIQGLGRGMFKLAKGPHNRDLLLFQQASSVYDDRDDGDARFVYTGMGQPQHGDQKWEGMNRYLGEHIERGISPHLFRQVSAKGPELEYVGEMVCEEIRATYIENEQRRVFRFDLARIESATQLISEYSDTFVRMKEEPNLVPYLREPKQVVSTKRQLSRDKAFGAVVRDAYRQRCAVCGETLARGEFVDLQGAHIRAVAERGPDEINNGICLCARHHWAFDHGVFALADDLTILMHREAGKDPHGEMEGGAAVELPRESEWCPHPEYLAFHRQSFAFG